MYKPQEIHVRPSRHKTSDNNAIAFGSMSHDFMLSNVDPEKTMIAREEFASVNSA